MNYVDTVNFHKNNYAGEESSMPIDVFNSIITQLRTLYDKSRNMFCNYCQICWFYTLLLYFMSCRKVWHQHKVWESISVS